MKRTIYLIGIIIIMLLCSFNVMAGDPFVVDENLEMGDNDVYNATNINSTNFYQDGSKVLDIDDINGTTFNYTSYANYSNYANYSIYANSSYYWDSLNNPGDIAISDLNQTGEEDLNVNSSDYWDSLNTPGEILISDLDQTGEANLNVNSSTWWAAISGWSSTMFENVANELGIKMSWFNTSVDNRITVAEPDLNVNSSDYWDSLNTPSDIAISDLDQTGETDLNVNHSTTSGTATTWDGETSQADLNVNNSDMLEGTDLGTLTDGKTCIYDLSETEIDCNTTLTTGTVTSVSTDDDYLTGGAITGSGTISFNSTLAGTNLSVNSSDYWDSYGTVTDLNMDIGCLADTFMTASNMTNESITCTSISDIYLLNSGDNGTGNYTFSGTYVNITGKLYSITINTGQGDNELYAMNQDVESTDNVSFDTITADLTGIASNATSWDDETSQADLNVNSSDYWDSLNNPGEILISDLDQTGEANLNVNSSDYWDSLGSPTDITSLGTISSSTSINSTTFTDGTATITGGSLTGGVDGNFTGELNSLTLNTGQGDYELYAMNQDLETSDSPTFAGGTYNSLFIDQNGDGIALNIDSEATSSNVVSISNEGTGNSLFLDQNGDGIGLFIDSEATTVGKYGLTVNTGGLTTASFGGSTETTASFLFTRNDVLANTAATVMKIRQDNSGDDQNALTIQNDGTGDGLLIDQNGDGIALRVSGEATTVAAIDLTCKQTSGDTILVLNTAAQTNAGRASIRIVNNNAGTTGQLLNLQHSGTGPSIKMSQTQDVEVIDFDACTDGGTSHTTVAGSIKVEMPNGATGYINVYT